MCGLFGAQYSEKLPAEERVLTTHLLGVGAESRGRHACGFAAYDGEAFLVHKEDEMFSRSDMRLIISRSRNFLAHTRYATVGAQTAENAHPFDYKHIIGAHNGGIFNYAKLQETYEEYASFKVDSQCLIAHIANARAYNELIGYGAVTWIDKNEPGAVYLCRLRNGDLVAERLADNLGIVWASTTNIIAEALRATDLYARSQPIHLQPGRIYVCAGGELYETDTRIDLAEPEIAKPPAYTMPSTYINTPYNGWMKHVGLDYWNHDSVPAVASTPIDPPATTPPHVAVTTQDELYIALRDSNLELEKADMDIIAENIINLTRRQRRRYTALIKGIKNHALACGCTLCDKAISIILQLVTK